MAEIVLSAALRDIADAMEIAASGGAGIVMSARSARDFLDALSICVIGAHALEYDLAQERASRAVSNATAAEPRSVNAAASSAFGLGPATDGALKMIEARAVELQTLSRRLAARLARLKPRELPVEMIAAQASLPPGERTILPFPVIGRPRPITDADMMDVLRAIAVEIAPGEQVDALNGDPLGCDRSEDGA
jgi:hypothetical protein